MIKPIVTIKNLALSLLTVASALACCGCVEPEREVEYVDRPVYVERHVVHHDYTDRAPSSDNPESFRAIEKPTTYSQ